MKAKPEQYTITKLNLMAGGKIQIMSDEELDLLAMFDLSNAIRSRPNPNQVGLHDTWECWIEHRDLAKFNTV